MRRVLVRYPRSRNAGIVRLHKLEQSLRFEVSVTPSLANNARFVHAMTLGCKQVQIENFGASSGYACSSRPMGNDREAVG